MQTDFAMSAKIANFGKNMETEKIKSEFGVKGREAGIDEAIGVALAAFRGKTDLDGKPAVLHSIEVGLAGTTLDAQLAGYLHDVVEDTEMTFEDLLEIGFPERVVDVLRLCTRDRDVPYEEYIDNILRSGSRTAVEVKLNDLNHNLARGKKTYEKALAENNASVLANITRINDKHEKAIAYIKSR